MEFCQRIGVGRVFYARWIVNALFDESQMWLDVFAAQVYVFDIIKLTHLPKWSSDMNMHYSEGEKSEN